MRARQFTINSNSWLICFHCCGRAYCCCCCATMILHMKENEEKIFKIFTQTNTHTLRSTTHFFRRTIYHFPYQLDDVCLQIGFLQKKTHNFFLSFFCSASCSLPKFIIWLWSVLALYLFFMRQFVP